MTTAARPTDNKIQLLTNVAVSMQIKYIDVYPDSGKGYGASMRLKGFVDGAEAIIYPRGKVWAAIKALKGAGVIDPNGEYEEEPQEKYAIPVKVTAPVEMCMKQGPGEKYATFVVASDLSSSSQTRHTAHNTQGPALPYEQETGGPPAPPTDRLTEKFALYDRCFEHAYKVATTAKITDQQAIASMTATLFIQASK
jgi:hypothetical protein